MNILLLCIPVSTWCCRRCYYYPFSVGGFSLKSIFCTFSNMCTLLGEGSITPSDSWGKELLNYELGEWREVRKAHWEDWRRALECRVCNAKERRKSIMQTKKRMLYSARQESRWSLRCLSVEWKRGGEKYEWARWNQKCKGRRWRHHMQTIPLDISLKDSPSFSLLLEKPLLGSPRRGNFENSEQCYWYAHYLFKKCGSSTCTWFYWHWLQVFLRSTFTLPLMPLTGLERTFGHVECYCGWKSLPKYMSKGFTTCNNVLSGHFTSQLMWAAVPQSLPFPDGLLLDVTSANLSGHLGISPKHRKDECTEIQRQSACGQSGFTATLSVSAKITRKVVKGEETKI